MRRSLASGSAAGAALRRQARRRVSTALELPGGLRMRASALWLLASEATSREGGHVLRVHAFRPQRQGRFAVSRGALAGPLVRRYRRAALARATGSAVPLSVAAVSVAAVVCTGSVDPARRSTRARHRRSPDLRPPASRASVERLVAAHARELRTARASSRIALWTVEHHHHAVPVCARVRGAAAKHTSSVILPCHDLARLSWTELLPVERTPNSSKVPRCRSASLCPGPIEQRVERHLKTPAASITLCPLSVSRRPMPGDWPAWPTLVRACPRGRFDPKKPSMKNLHYRRRAPEC